MLPWTWDAALQSAVVFGCLAVWRCKGPQRVENHRSSESALCSRVVVRSEARAQPHKQRPGPRSVAELQQPSRPMGSLTDAFAGFRNVEAEARHPGLVTQRTIPEPPVTNTIAPTSHQHLTQSSTFSSTYCSRTTNPIAMR